MGQTELRARGFPPEFGCTQNWKWFSSNSFPGTRCFGGAVISPINSSNSLAKSLSPRTRCAHVYAHPDAEGDIPQLVLTTIRGDVDEQTCLCAR